ncbi:MAG: carboxyvinyl-carboxyphosphonate phosphorylmutase [Desulfobacteraceae bacterium]|nr:carboxyvinyl-carboxyphosphonate phosphorylmutase [Desulfobacteraceae bacterium]
MKKTTLLKKYILDDEILVMPGAHDVLCARIIEKTGFKALTMGGYSSSATLLGKPDVSLLSMTEMADCYRRVAANVDIPLFVDGDTGFGGVLNVCRTVMEMERTGAAGMFIEDQVFPKRCGHMEGKEVIPAEEMVSKVKAAVDARVDEDFVIMARTDALAVNGIDDAIERGNLYRQAGADLIFVEAPTTIEQMQKITTQVACPTMANNIEGGKSPFLTAEKLQETGYSSVVFPVAATYALAKVIGDLMETIKKSGTSEGFWDNMLNFNQFSRLIGLDDLRRLEKSYFDE